MHNDESVASYFLCIDEIVNCMKKLGEEIKEVVLVEKVLRSLSPKFDSKVSAIEEKQNLQSLTMSQLHGILIAYEMRKGGPSDKREAAFKALGKGDYYESGHMSEEEEESIMSRTFNGELVDSKRSPLIKTSLRYSEETSQAQKQAQKPSTSKSYLDAVRRSEQVNNRQQKYNANHQGNQGQFASRIIKEYQVNRGQSTSRMNRSLNRPQVNHSQFGSRMDGNYNHMVGRFDNCRNFFNGQCFSCHNFGHKAAQCVAYKTIMTREAKKKRSMTGIMKRTYNNFYALENEIECSICNNFGHEDSECKSRFRQTTQKEQASLSSKTWKKKETQPERCGIALYAEGEENQWYIDSGCSKHMKSNKEKLQPYSALEKEKKVSFGNDTPAFIKGKGSVHLKEKVKAGNVMYVDGLKHNLLSVSQMCDQGTEIRKACKYQAVRDLPDIRIPDNTICKSCQFGKQTGTNFPEKEGSASRPLELVHTDICGPTRKRSPRGEEYFTLFIDDFSRMCWIGLMNYKDEAFENFKSFKALVENESDRRIKCLRSDRGGEFTSDEFFDFCEEHRIRREFSAARTP
eukprot:PITA_13040